MYLIVAIVCLILYGLTSTWRVINQETMLALSKAGYWLNDLEIKVLRGEATNSDKIKLIPRYIMGAYFQPSMILLYIILGVIVWLKYFK